MVCLLHWKCVVLLGLSRSICRIWECRKKMDCRSSFLCMPFRVPEVKVRVKRIPSLHSVIHVPVDIVPSVTACLGYWTVHIKLCGLRY